MESIAASQTQTVAYEPVTIVLRTLALVGETERWSGLNPWLVRLAEAVSPSELRTNWIVFGQLRSALDVGAPGLSFPAYLAALASADAYAARDRAVEGLRSRLSRTADSTSAHPVPSVERLLSDRETFIVSAAHVAQSDPFALPTDADLLHQAYTLLGDPGRLLSTLVEHLTALWERSFAAEWRRIERMLSWHAQMYARALHEQGATLPLTATFRELTGRDLDARVVAALAGARQVVLVPCWHLGRWALPWDLDDGAPRLCFSEPPNAEISLLRGTPVTRRELRARMAALADETRLRIVEMVRARDEMTAQEIVAALDLSQSNVSRHLNQLVQMGYLFQRRGEGASKSYRVSAYHLDRTAAALRRLAAGEAFEPAAPEADVSRELRRFVDRAGRLTSWPPARERDKLLILEYLAAGFEPGQIYSEREVGDVLDRRSTVPDHAALRRALYEFRFMNRTRDGSRYWLSGTLADEVPPDD